MRLPLDNYRLSQGWHPGHGGWDLAAPKGTAVKAPVTGTIVSVGSNRRYLGGLYVIIREDHSDGWEYYTGHHDSTSVRVGQRVSEGQEIARVGATGTATGPHVHFQVRHKNKGSLINPQSVIDARRVKVVQAVSKVGNGTLHLPASATSWRVYAPGTTPKAGSEKGTLKPSKYGGLSYAILGRVSANVVRIHTRVYGVVDIFVAPNTGAVIK